MKLKERSILELLKILLQERRRKQTDGICMSIVELHYGDKETITRGEYEKLEKYFQSQKPSDMQHGKFTTHSSWGGKAYWWSRDDEGNEQRLLFIEHLIKKQKSWFKRMCDKIWWV